MENEQKGANLSGGLGLWQGDHLEETTSGSTRTGPVTTAAKAAPPALQAAQITFDDLVGRGSGGTPCAHLKGGVNCRREVSNVWADAPTTIRIDTGGRYKQVRNDRRLCIQCEDMEKRQTTDEEGCGACRIGWAPPEKRDTKSPPVPVSWAPARGQIREMLKSAAAGIYTLGCRYASGLGTAPSVARATQCWELAKSAGETRAINAVQVIQARRKETERQELGFLEEKWIAVARRAAKGVSKAWRDNGGGSDYTMLGGDFLELIQTRQVATDTEGKAGQYPAYSPERAKVVHELLYATGAQMRYLGLIAFL